MATQIFSRMFLSNPTATKALASLLYRSFSTTATTKPFSRSLPLLFLNRLRPLSAAVRFGSGGIVTGPSARGMSTRPATASLNDSSPNWSNRPPKETILLDGCDFEHWLVVMEKPEGDPTRDEIIDRYIKTLAAVFDGREDEARMKIYSVSTKHYYAFGALVDEETSYKLKELPGVRWVLPDSYLDVKNKDYGGEPFINGQAVPYDPKYHEEWVRNNARANERNRRNDRPRSYDRSRNFERRRENMQNRNFQNQGMPNPAPNMSGMPPNNVPPSSNMSPNMGSMPQNNLGGMPQNNYGGTPQPNNYGGMPPPNNYAGAPPPQNNYGGAPPPQNKYGGTPPPQNNYGGTLPPQSNYGGTPPPQSNYGGTPPPQSNYGGTPPPQNNYGGAPPPQNNYGGTPPPQNYGGTPPPQNYGGTPPQNNYGGTPPPQNNYGGMQPPPNYNSGNMGGMLPNTRWSGNTPGNMNQSADGPSYQNSYTPRQ
ncbi:hypothetical protein AB3S75_019776 [Citrus x aurantiifolia]